MSITFQLSQTFAGDPYTVARVLSDEPAATVDENNPATMTFAVPVGLWVATSVQIVAANAYDAPIYYTTPYYGAFQGNNVVSAQVSLSYPGFDAPDVVYTAQQGDGGAPSDLFTPALAYVFPAFFVAADDGSSGNIPNAVTQKVQGYSVLSPILSPGAGGDANSDPVTASATISLLPAGQSNGNYPGNRADTTLSGVRGILYLQSIAPTVPQFHVEAQDTTPDSLPPPAISGAAQFVLGAKPPDPRVFDPTQRNGLAPFSYAWEVADGFGFYTFQGKEESGPAPTTLTGNHSAEIAFEYDHPSVTGYAPSGSYDEVVMRCTATSAAYPYQVDAPRFARQEGAVEYITRRPPALVTPPRRACLSAPGSRYCRAEDVQTKDPATSGLNPAGIQFWRAGGPVPKLDGGALWETAAVIITANKIDTSPALALDSRGLIYCAFARASTPAATGDGIVFKRSDDYGSTWGAVIDTEGNTEIMAIPGGLLPAIASGGGSILVGAIVGTDQAGYTLSTCYKANGSAAFSAPVQVGGVTPPSASPAVMKVQKSGIGLCRAAEGPNRWVLTVLMQGESTTSEWWSADNGASWTRIPAS